MTDQTKKEKRAEIFKAALDEAKVPDWGRAAAITKATGCSPASAQAWIRGSLPSECERLVQMCDLYNIDLYLWVDLKSRSKPEPVDNMVEAILYVKEFEAKSDIILQPSQFAHFCGVYLDAGKREGFDELVSILKKS